MVAEVDMMMLLLLIRQEQWPRPEDPPVQGWAFESGYPNTIGFEEHFALYNDMVDWIRQHVVNYQQNALWTKIRDCIYIKLRKEQDAMMFLLKFGSYA